MGMQNVGGRRKRESSQANVTDYQEEEEEEEEEEDVLFRRILLIGDNFLRAWLRNKLTDSKTCQLRNICEANTAPFLEGESSNIVQMASTFSEVATNGLIREISLATLELELEYYEAGGLGEVTATCHFAS